MERLQQQGPSIRLELHNVVTRCQRLNDTLDLSGLLASHGAQPVIQVRPEPCLPGGRPAGRAGADDGVFCLHRSGAAPGSLPRRGCPSCGHACEQVETSAHLVRLLQHDLAPGQTSAVLDLNTHLDSTLDAGELGTFAANISDGS